MGHWPSTVPWRFTGERDYLDDLFGLKDGRRSRTRLITENGREHLWQQRLLLGIPLCGFQRQRDAQPALSPTAHCPSGQAQLASHLAMVGSRCQGQDQLASLDQLSTQRFPMGELL